MSEDLKDILCPEQEIPWDEAAAFFVVTKEATEQPQLTPIQDAKLKGAIAGVRSASSSDITHAARVKRTRGERTGKNIGTAGGATLGYLAGRAAKGGGWKSRAAGTAIGAVLGGEAGKTIGLEADRKRIIKKYSPTAKKAEMEKQSAIDRVRSLWKIAQGEPMTEGEQGPDGATPSPQVVEPNALTNEHISRAPQNGKAGPSGKAGGPTPEDLDALRAQEELQQEAMMDELGAQEEAEYYRQLLEQTTAENEQLGGQLQETQAQAEQAGQQAQMVQMQADQAVQQAAQQAQMSAQEKQQLSMQLDGAATEALQSKENIMQMRQAMQAYRENLQSIVLQDPTAAVGPSPEEQGMEPPPSEQMAAQGADQNAVEEAQQAEQAQQEAQQQTSQAEQAAANDVAKKSSPKPKKQEGGSNPNVTVNVEKKGSAIPELLRSDIPFDKTATGWKHRAIGAAIGAPIAAGVQSLSDQVGKGGVSKKEKALRESLKSLERKKDKGAMAKHQTNITRALYGTAKTNREHPQSAAALAGVMGAITGASVGPSIGRGIKGTLKRLAQSGGKK